MVVHHIILCIYVLCGYVQFIIVRKRLYLSGDHIIILWASAHSLIIKEHIVAHSLAIQLRVPLVHNMLLLLVPVLLYIEITSINDFGYYLFVYFVTFFIFLESRMKMMKKQS